MSPTAAITERAEFRNDANHVIGVVTKRGRNEMKSMALQPGDTVWLDEEEQIATANAPRSDEDNPFTNGHLTLVTQPKEIVNRRQIGYSDHQQVGDLAKEESGPGGDTGSPGGDGSAGSDGAGDDAPPEPPKAPEQPQGGVPEGKVAPSLPGAAQTPAQAAQAKAAAARATGAAAETPKPAAPAKAPQGERAATEEVATPEAQGK
jgi:hypothetical protein